MEPLLVALLAILGLLALLAPLALLALLALLELLHLRLIGGPLTLAQQRILLPPRQSKT